jgi:hypothetical protein
VVRRNEITAGRKVPYEEVAERVYQDWKEDTSARLTSQAVRELGRHYRIRFGSAT